METDDRHRPQLKRCSDAGTRLSASRRPAPNGIAAAPITTRMEVARPGPGCRAHPLRQAMGA